MQEIRLTAGVVGEVVFLGPRRDHDDPDERGCPHCGDDAYFSGCDAPGCNGWGCPDCGEGCDLDFVDAEDGGRCAGVLGEDDEEANDDND